MKISQISGTYFSGVKRPYSRNGYEIKPIYANPNEDEIKQAIDATKTTSPFGKGLNGYTYPYSYLGRDLVVKKYLPKSESYNKNAYDTESEKLDLLYESKISSDSIQQGKYAFRTPEGGEYLVSTMIHGENPDTVTNKFNKENLFQLVNTIIELDMPIKNNNDNDFPYSVLMHYDLCGGNILMDKENAGIIDFEYSKCEDLNEYYMRGKQNILDANCNFSDVACLPSNLRGFEYRTLLLYLLKSNEKEASELFDTYLKYKSNYHQAMGDFYRASMDMDNEKIFDELSLREISHANVLISPDRDVKKAEAMKMQIARFMYVQSPFEIYKLRVNVNQIHEYLDNALAFFENKANEENQDRYHKIYYQDGLELVKKWQGLHSLMEYQAENSDKLFHSKLTDMPVITLEEHLNLL